MLTLDLLLNILLEPLQYGFMQRAILAALLLGLVSGVMGAYVVTRGLAFMGDALAHSILPGVAIAFLLGATGAALLAGGLVAGTVSALIIGFLTRGRRMQEDTAIGIVFAGMLALGIAIISASRSFATDLQHLLIGNILAVSETDLLLMAGLGLAMLLIVGLLYKELLIVSFDPLLAQTLRLPGEALRILLLVLLAIAIVIGTQAAGIALVTATLVTPAAAARLLTKRLHRLMLVAAGIGALCGAAGMYLAWYLNIAASPAIVLLMTLVFGLVFLFAPGKGYVWSLLGRSAHRA
ncbi:MAG: metal ABC transporter permease [Anaerolineae bacterium]|jgi:ABC-type Mn2+/Zn2+ transport system permease subunit|nr:metal ABC transporter permease [Anaerolineae bacterium]